MTSNSTDTGAASATETISADGIATPYFMLVQMNNAALLEAYATLGISPRPAKIDERNHPDGFSLAKALGSIPFGRQDRAEHPGKIHKDAPDPIAEVESRTTGKVTDTLALAADIASRFAGQSGAAGDAASLFDAALASKGAPELDFDPDTSSIGRAVLAAMSNQTSSVPDFAGSAPFTGMRMDYRPETAPMGPKKTTANRHSFQSTHSGPVDFNAALSAVVSQIMIARKRGAGTGRKVSQVNLTDRADD